MKQIHHAILALSLPSIVANITTPLLGMADVGVTGHMGNPAYLAAIAVGSTVVNMLYWTLSFLRMGTSGLTAQAWGRNDRRGQSTVLLREGLIAVSTGVLLIAFSPLYARPLIGFFDPGAETAGFVLRYFMIVVWGAPAVLLTYVMTGWFLGRQNSRITMWTSVTINVVNIAVSLMMVYWAGWKIEGVATGTLVAQWVGAMMFIVAAWGAHPERVAASEIFSFRGLGSLFKVNTALLARTLFLIAVTVAFTRIGARQGTEILAANAMLMQLFMLFSFFMDGFAFAGEALVGKDVGARDAVGLRRTVLALLKWSGALALLFTVIYVTTGEWLLGMFTDDSSVLARSREYAAWSYAIPLAGFAAFAWDGVYVGATLNRSMLLTMGLAACVFFAVYALTFPRMGNHGLWLAFLAYLLTRGLVQTIMWPRIVSRTLPLGPGPTKQ